MWWLQALWFLNISGNRGGRIERGERGNNLKQNMDTNECVYSCFWNVAAWLGWLTSQLAHVSIPLTTGTSNDAVPLIQTKRRRYRFNTSEARNGEQWHLVTGNCWAWVAYTLRIRFVIGPKMMSWHNFVGNISKFRRTHLTRSPKHTFTSCSPLGTPQCGAIPATHAYRARVRVA